MPSCLLRNISGRKVDTSVDRLVEEFEAEWKPETGSYSRKFVEYCSAKALTGMCQNIEEKIGDGSFSQLTFDMMLAWELPSSEDEESHRVCDFFPLSFQYELCAIIVIGKEESVCQYKAQRVDLDTEQVLAPEFVVSPL